MRMSTSRLGQKSIGVHYQIGDMSFAIGNDLDNAFVPWQDLQHWINSLSFDDH